MRLCSCRDTMELRGVIGYRTQAQVYVPSTIEMLGQQQLCLHGRKQPSPSRPGPRKTWKLLEVLSVSKAHLGTPHAQRRGTSCSCQSQSLVDHSSEVLLLRKVVLVPRMAWQKAGWKLRIYARLLWPIMGCNQSAVICRPTRLVQHLSSASCKCKNCKCIFFCIFCIFCIFHLIMAICSPAILTRMKTLINCSTSWTQGPLAMLLPAGFKRHGGP
jgi:hypothetical protein